MSNGGVEDEELRRRKLEEALEVKSLRRIISAYLNYPDAAEEDVKRYERSFRRLPPAHKALLSHLPLKFQRLRWCISKNSFFIFNMLQAFDPPLDMSQDTDVCEPENLKNVSDCNTSCCEKNVCSDQSASAWGQMSSVESDEDYSRVGGNSTCRSPHMVPVNKEEKLVHYNEFGCGSSASSQCNENLDISGGVDVKSLSNEAATCSLHDCNGNFQVSERCELLWNLDCVVILSCSLKLGDANELGYKVVEAVSLFPPDASAKVSSLPSDWLDRSFQLHVPLVDVDKVRCIIRNIVRDWAAEGQRERDQCYKPILEELEAQFPDRWKDNPSCLVPGAGLGRLALEISCRGFVCQGNEFSYYMMICSSFILNHAQTVGEWTIYPWIHSNCNSLSDSDQLRPVLIPDVHPASAGITEGFSMCGGDFVEVYSDLSQVGIWDAVVTCFFIDTAHNVVEYIEIISRILRDGGVWINFGPLLYHFADMYGQQDEMSIELSLEDVKRVALHYGLQLEKESTIETTYTTNPQSMMQNRYYAAFWTMRKKEMATEQQQGT